MTEAVGAACGAGFSAAPATPFAPDPAPGTFNRYLSPAA